MSDTVLPTRGMTSIAHMNAIGLMMALAIAFVLLPVLPLLAVLYVLGKRWGSTAGPRFRGARTEQGSAHAPQE